MCFLPVFSLLSSGRELASPSHLAAAARANGALRHVQLSRAVTVEDGLFGVAA